jgi:c-di-GMP-binding flagellar brake protein YcgR
VPDPGKIEGPKLDTLFESLIADKTIISMHVAGTDFQKLTCITAVERTPDGNRLLVDCPEGFSRAIANIETLDLRFNFNGDDHLEYIFHTSGGSLNGGEVKVPFPDYVERLQRRKNFRIDTIPGTRLFISSGKLEGRIDLINISLGGAFGLLGKHNQKDPTGSLLNVNQRLYNVRIIFPADNIMEETSVTIKKAEVRRIERDRERKQYKYAIEFLVIDKENLQELTTAIYHIQRRFLQNR